MWIGGLGDHRRAGAPVGADGAWRRVSDGGGSCKIGYCWAPGVHDASAVAKLPLEFDKDGWMLRAAPWGRGTRKQ